LIKFEDGGSYRLPLPHITTPKNTAAEQIQTGQWCGAYPEDSPALLVNQGVDAADSLACSGAAHFPLIAE